VALKVFGASYSVYSRILRLALAEKDTPHDWVETDVFGDDRAAQTARHPFGKIPSIEHDGFALYETGACLRYLEQPSFGAVRLVPEDPRLRAKADQIAGIVDAYGYKALVWDVFVELRKARRGEATDQARVENGLQVSARVLDAVAGLTGTGGAFLVGEAPSFADIYLAPVLAYFVTTAPGREQLAGRPQLRRWWEGWQARPSMAATQYPREE
jgi:glutathione S-transferase